MATNLDLEEQEQLDQIKAFWNKYGNLISGILVAALLAYAGWNGWNWWKRDQAVKAASMYDELERASRAGEVEKTAQVFADMKERFPRTTYTEHAALLAAKVQTEKGQPDAAVAALTWAADNAAEDEYRTIARLRLAGLLLDQKKYDEALKQVDAAKAKGFEGLAADRRGDILAAQGKADDAKAAYNQAWQALASSAEYRRLVEAKLTAMGASPQGEATKATP